jgi:hypothetical protein
MDLADLVICISLLGPDLFVPICRLPRRGLILKPEVINLPGSGHETGSRRNSSLCKWESGRSGERRDEVP